jgi:hypothetical protein
MRRTNTVKLTFTVATVNGKVPKVVWVPNAVRARLEASPAMRRSKPRNHVTSASGALYTLARLSRR